MKVDDYSCSKCVGEISEFIKYGKTCNGKQRYQCKRCKATSVLHFSYNAYKRNINHTIILFTKEGLGIRSMARVLKISTTTLLKRIIKISDKIKIPALKFHQSYELDEMRIFIRKKTNPVWIVYAVDKITKQLTGFYIGKRNNKTLNAVVKTLVNSKAEKIYTDKLWNYKYLVPKEIHFTKKYATNGIERKNLNLRTHLKRLNRKTICFSRSSVILSSVLKIYFWSCNSFQ
ncbi:IS1 family transposase [Chryseobacterium sp. NKUCC03_KSP]|uniref:IS1 family transposase n=1 Tax=Chryseobacterium sp. NKUCC03_KSP TaxID=2842125 RepID=UPI001C5B99CD|nr:IS1 family transposase [Chryseobacterium sp. NKUCC03_KSP]MBW3522135.1 IS1 family transposase [Chryseobacterium sp. NKUCC03_KSP]